MLTLFTIPKAFRGHFGIIQRNAITSWTLLQPRPEIILFGDDEGTADVARELGVRHVAEVARNEFGTPLLSSAFQITQETGQGRWLAYANADIIFMSDLVEAIRRVPFAKCVLSGQRWDFDQKEPLDFRATDWEARLRAQVAQSGKLRGRDANDYFVFTRGVYGQLPPFAIGRPAWDNWLLFHSRCLRVPVIDISASVMAVHQNHDYSHHPEGAAGVNFGVEAQRNRKYQGGIQHAFTLEDATHRLSPKGIKRTLRRQDIPRHLVAFSILHPWSTPLTSVALLSIRLLRPFLNICKRHRSGCVGRDHSGNISPSQSQTRLSDGDGKK